MLNANANAFHAYKILYYDIDNTAKLSASSPSKNDMAKALTVQENLSGTPYKLSERSLAALAEYYASIASLDNCDEAMIDPAADIRLFEPDTPGNPMYPDFPSQVIEMDEDDFRFNQIAHYLSTYGVEEIFAFFGTPMQVMEGWRPDVESTEKTQDDDVLAAEQIIELVFSPSAMMEMISNELERPMRMSQPAIELMLELLANENVSPVSSIAFHENMMEIIRTAAAGSAKTLENCLSKVAQHPGDILKAVVWVCEQDCKKHLATRQKKAFCRALENYSAISIATNIVDLGKTGRKAANMLSVARFAGPVLTQAFEMVENKEVVSYNSRLEQAWKDFSTSNDSAKLLSTYGQRPGVLLRSLTRLAKCGVALDDISAEFNRHVEDYSLATLVKLASSLGACDTAQYLDFAGNDDKQTRQFENRIIEKLNVSLCEMILPVIKEKLADIATPLKQQKVFVDAGPFSLQGSVVVPNENGNTADAYPPVGMAYDVPADKTVRFFTFWNDRRNRVDVDIHFFGDYKDGNRFHIGWNAPYKLPGMVTSGDITDSTNAAEYLDIDMKEALDNGALFAIQHQHIYSGPQNWKDISECYSGALLVSNKGADVKLYNGENVIFRDDMKGTGRELDYAIVDIPGHWVRILRGTKLSFRNTTFSLGAYIEMLLSAQECVRVNSREEADIVLSIGRSDDEDAICLIDNKFFIS